MTKILRAFQKIFASNNDSSSNFGNGQFGSGKLGTKVITDDVEQLQNLSAFLSGWKNAVMVNSSGQPSLPPLEEMQALDYICTYQLAYLFQEGIPEYNADTTYYENSIVKAPGTYQLFGSLTDNNIGNPTSDPTNWVLLADLSTLVTSDETVTVDNQITLFSGTSGHVLKKATITALLKATGGVLQAAVAGVDYLAPGGGILSALTSGSSYTITNTSFIAIVMGAGGGGGDSTTGNGGNGGNTTFGSLTGSGGNGGVSGNSNTVLRAPNGGASGGDINISGKGSIGGTGIVAGSPKLTGATGGSGGMAIKLFSGQTIGSTISYSVGAAGTGSFPGNAGLIIIYGL